MQKVKLLKCTGTIKILISCAIILLMGMVYIFTSDKESIPKDYSTQEKVSESIQESTAKINKTLIYVYVCGNVVNPGVYEANADMRVFQLIELAGGVNEHADISVLNMADTLKDGQKIYVPSYDESTEQSNYSIESETSLININTATKEQLMTLPGIGESKAADIISYRQSKGKFTAVEDIKKISGIKDAAYNKIKDYITVK